MKRVGVVGASSGLGRCIGMGLAAEGDRVAFLARRLERCEAAAAEAGSGAVAVACDVTDEAGARAAIDTAADALGGIDALIYSTGIGHLAPIEEVDAATLRHVFETNVIGAHTVTAAALPHLKAAQGMAAYLSSVSASLTPAWPGLSPYVVTKTALDKLVEAWRVEHPAVGFTRLTVGDCTGGEGESMTEFATNWDGDHAMKFAPLWVGRALMAGNLMEVDELVAVVDTLVHLGASATVPEVAVTPRAAPLFPEG